MQPYEIALQLTLSFTGHTKKERLYSAAKRISCEEKRLETSGMYCSLPYFYRDFHF